MNFFRSFWSSPETFRYVAAVVRPTAFDPNSLSSSHPLYPISPSAMQVYDYENGDYGEFETMLVTIITHDGDNDDNVNDDNENTDDENIDDKDENDDNEENSDNDDTGNDDNLREFP